MPLIIRLKLSSPIDFYDASDIGDKLRDLREDIGYSRFTLFKESGVHYQTIKKIEQGEHVAAHYIRKMFDYFNIDPFNL